MTVWAPRAERVTLQAGEHRLAMQRDEAGWWFPAAPLPAELASGPIDYGFILDDDERALPDPRSRRQPHGVHELSQTFDLTGYPWSDTLWTGKQLAGGVIYELHVGTFTPEGTLTAAIERLDHLAAVGIDFVELMPVNAFNGTHNWGYDGVLWYAVHEGYGGPLAYQQFVDACHQRGLGVIQDVVYNHLGPSGNYLPRFGPYLIEGQQNTWGDSVNLDGEDSDEVRRYIIENAMMWLRDFHVDGLRLDAVHALQDNRATHILEELAVEVEALSAFVARPLTLIAESDLNNPRLITPREGGGYGLTAQWSDDFHHALYVSLTGDTSGYYADFDSLAALGKVYENGFFHDGTRSSFRGRTHGDRIDTLRTPTWRLVVCSDNHDQIGNRAAGDRLASRLDRQQLGLAAMLTVLSPFTPMIFMGEEWGASTPWQFFTSHPEPELAEAVSKGRLEEFEQMDWDLSVVPDPQDPQTFMNSKLNWSEPSKGAHAELLALYTRLIELRRTYPDVVDPRFDRAVARSDDDRGWLLVERGQIALAANFSDRATALDLSVPGEVLLAVGTGEVTAERVRLGPHSGLVLLLSDDATAR
nr:malto-oligosyltrehalose trehalohydrolase [Microlunatus panaciterrae]